MGNRTSTWHSSTLHVWGVTDHKNEMKTDKLYDEYTRTRQTHSGQRESSFHFLNESDWNWVNYVRQTCEIWYDKFPVDMEFISNFKSKNDYQHKSAFFELYVHALFKKIGGKIIYHEKLGNRKIDFAIDLNDHIILTDCVLSGEPNIDRSIDNIEGDIIDMIESIDSPNYYVNIDFRITSSQTPKISKLKNEIEKRIQNAVENLKEEDEFNWKNKDWEVTISLIKKYHSIERTLGSIIQSHGGGFIDHPSMNLLRNTLDNKRGSSYGVTSPYIISANSSNYTLTQRIIQGALYGQSIQSQSLCLEQAFFYSSKPQNRSVSGVLIVHNLVSANIGCVEIQYWINPWANFSIDHDTLPFNSFIPILDTENMIIEIKEIQGKKVNEILEIRKHIISDQ